MRLAVKETETKDLFEILANKSPVGLCIIQDGKFCYTNPTFRHNTGYREDELLGRDSLELIVPEDRKMVKENAIKMLKGELSVPDQFRVIHKDGSIHWVVKSVASIQYRGRRATLGTFVDITENKQMEEALQAEKNKLQSLIDAVEDTVTIQDTEYNIIYQNEPSKIASGGDHLGEKCYRVYEGQEKIGDDCPVKKAFEDGKSHTVERKVTLSSGKVTFWENTANPIRDAGGRIVSCLELARDITERKQAEEELKLRAQILDSATDAIFVHDSDDNFIYVNEAACRIHGYTREEFSKMKLPQLIDPKRSGSLALDRQIMLEKGHLVVESVHLRKDGSLMPLEIHARTLGSSKGKLFLTVARDITERKRMEEALRASEEKLRKMFESVTDGISVIDLKGIVTEVNQRAVEMHGFRSKDELRGKSAFDLVASRDHERVAAEMKKAIKQEVIRRAECTLLRADGSEFPGELSTSVLKDASNNVVGHISIVRDITERRQAEEERGALLQDITESNRRLEWANKELQDFVYVASHDLREPLRKISSFGTLLRDSLKGKLDEDQQENFEFMIDGARRMQDMTDALLAYSRLTTRAKPPEQVDLNKVIEDLKKLELATLLDETRGVIHVPKPLPSVQADPSQVHQLFQNLIGNGLKFHKEGILPEIIIRAHEVENNMMRIEVEDNGIGIDEKYHGQLFVMFKRLHSREQYEGTGIGLAICKKIVERHGGTIGVKSTPDKGSTFWFTLPTESYLKED
jgi:PAS domain S-box-containing protein